MDSLLCVFILTSLQWERKLRQWILGTVLRPCAFMASTLAEEVSPPRSFTSVHTPPSSPPVDEGKVLCV